MPEKHLPSQSFLSIANLFKGFIALGLTLGLYILPLNAQDSLQVQPAAAPDGLPTDPAIIEGGQTLFKNNCAVCHAIHEEVVGPALKGVYERKDIAWLNAFIRNSQKVIESGDPYAVQLYEQYNKTQMTAFDFKDDEILSILAYIKQETLNPPTAAPVTSATGVNVQPSGSGIPQGYLIAILAGLVVILLLILVVLILLVTTLTRYLKQKGGLDETEKELIEQRFDFGAFVRSPGVVFIVVFVFLTIAAKSMIDGLYAVGVQQDYAPTQPIAFSHKLHAGDYAIDCQYCHTGVMSGKSANIPSANICMNCHGIIVKVTGQEENSKEIAKIHDAVMNNKPIEWVRVHNLPDLAYFNHAQHYNAGKIECQNCHGPVETMEVVKQYTNLTMGWCIDCHRTTEVNVANGYYDKLVEIHKEHKGKAPMYVEDIGGLECSKCHY